MSSDLDVRLADHIRTSGLFEPPGLSLLAVSGGPDSIALLDLMATLGEDIGLALAVAHVEHGIQPVTTPVADAVESWARRYGLPCHVAKLNLGAGTSETTARRERYRALRSMQAEQNARFLVTAHHMDDQVETVVYRFLRGSGVAGLAGIPERGSGGLVRPLLPFSRRDLTGWLETRFPDMSDTPGLFFDPANLDETHDRVWIRAVLLPLLRQRMGRDVARRVRDVAADAACERAAWASAVRALPDLQVRTGKDRIEVARTVLRRYDKVLSIVLLRVLAREVGCRLGRRRAEELRKFAALGSSGRVMQLGSGWEAELAFDDLVIGRRNDSPAVDVAEGIRRWGVGDEGRVRWCGWEFRWRSEPAGIPQRSSLHTWVTPGAGEIRAPRAGDKVFPLGGMGRRKVRRLLMEGHIPVRDRRSYPVVVRGGEIIWIPGISRAAGSVPPAGDLSVRIDARSTGRG